MASVNYVIIFYSDNGLSPLGRQNNAFTNGDVISIAPLGTNCSEFLFKIQKVIYDIQNVVKPGCSIAPWHVDCNVVEKKGITLDLNHGKISSMVKPRSREITS